jgi:hypothetical protein
VLGFGNTFGAVYNPSVVIVPTVPLPPCTPATSQFTAAFAVPVTVAVKGTVFPSTTEVAVGKTLTEIPLVFPPVLEL